MVPRSCGHLQYKCQRAVDNDLGEVCRYGLALRAIGTGQRVLKVSAKT